MRFVAGTRSVLLPRSRLGGPAYLSAARPVIPGALARGREGKKMPAGSERSRQPSPEGGKGRRGRLEASAPGSPRQRAGREEEAGWKPALPAALARGRDGKKMPAGSQRSRQPSPEGGKGRRGRLEASAPGSPRQRAGRSSHGHQPVVDGQGGTEPPPGRRHTPRKAPSPTMLRARALARYATPCGGSVRDDQRTTGLYPWLRYTASCGGSGAVACMKCPPKNGPALAELSSHLRRPQPGTWFGKPEE